MSRTLTRPMFRMGGAAEGITSGLDKPRQQYANGDKVQSALDTTIKAQEAIQKAGFVEPLTGPIEMMIQFGIALPKSQYRKRKPVARQWRTKKPDLDNLMKLVKDACSGVIFLDDNQVVRVIAEKIQCGQEEAPFTKVRFSEIEDL